ncbi:ubiquinone biosynthesis accessory factor UbiJ [Hahella ganghwensis]|uniref:ubiquinone biosynthesis accessory factor UbiJ n=1 Tax=Hahella ganghwensis TaxID=286420 RepID=UPI00037C7497|nr:SCP2 sterol-binding domain-containing protein [Hahella ganghwensis]
MINTPTIQAALSAALEQVANQALSLDAAATQRLEKLAGKWLAVEVLPFQLELFFELGYPLRVAIARDEENDLTLKGSPGVFLRYMQGDHNAEGLELAGDVALAQQLAAILSSLEVDWEAKLSEFLGDVPAHLVGKGARGVTGWLAHVSQSFFADAEEYIHHEAHSLPNKDEAEYWSEQVEQARMTLDRLEARVKRLESHAQQHKVEDQQ